jgi:cytochrome d ubiquinol oxidase subunit I
LITPSFWRAFNSPLRWRHIVFPSFTIGLVAWIAALEALWLSTGRDRFINWPGSGPRFHAISFAVGVVSGLVMSYQLGINWSRFSRTLGNIIGPTIGYEVASAFFLEATFLGIMLFGRTRVPRALRFAATVSVVLERDFRRQGAPKAT